jgi:hypothetical protein
MSSIIGRENEKKVLEELYTSSESEFLAVYGRRRIGKTYLIRQFFKRKGFFFEITGSALATPKEQIARFQREYGALFQPEGEVLSFKDWSEALHQLQLSLRQLTDNQKVTLFFDELPWLCKGSDFLSALEYCWNRHLSDMPNVLLIVCGSAAHWMLHNIVNNRGGLYGRLTAQMNLAPFSLSETETYLHAMDVKLPRKQICELYMTTGGVAKYLSYVKSGFSVSQTVNQLCFRPQSPLLPEFHRLYHSLFSKATAHVAIVNSLGTKRRGLKRLELLAATGLPNNGRTTTILEELELSGFVMQMPQYLHGKKEFKYYLIDEYSFFYLAWIDGMKSQILSGTDPDHWMKLAPSPSWNSWSGYAFEAICLKHIHKIREALQIGGVSCTVSHWKMTADSDLGERGVEIDLVIDRADNCINLCEMKFSCQEFSVSPAYAEELERKKRLFREKTKSKKALFTTLITSHGLSASSYATGAVDQSLTIEDLF